MSENDQTNPIGIVWVSLYIKNWFLFIDVFCVVFLVLWYWYKN